MMFKIIGGGLMLFGAIDLICFYILHINLTGQWWTPIAAFLIGGFIWGMGDKNNLLKQ